MGVGDTVDQAITVLVVDDHQMIVESLVRLLGDQPDIVVVGTASTGGEAVDAAAQLQPDVVVMDFLLPDMDGVATAGRVVDKSPQSRVVILTGSDVDEAPFAAASSGCAGYIEKTRAVSELARAIRLVHAGGTVFPEDQLANLPHLDELRVHYQPVIQLSDEGLVGFEALVRWAHPTRGLLAPAEFIGLAERTGMIVELGHQVMAEACAQAVRWRQRYRAEPALDMSVNVSGVEFRQPDFTEQVRDILAQSAVDPSTIAIEITETVLLEDDAANMRRLHELKGLGVHISLDDFGTGYSSLSYLRRFPIDVIKVDKTFTDGVPGTERTISVMHAISRLAAEMDATSQAEGIEQPEQAAVLREMGWDLGQGYHFARPLAADAAQDYLDAHLPLR